jgi:hypothetical protein
LQKAVRRSDPKHTTAIFSEAARVVTGERRVVFLIEDVELNAIETGCASFSCYPEISIAGLNDLVNTILRKTVFARPKLMS